MTERNTKNTIGDYILKEMDRMLYDHVPFKTIAQNINTTLSEQNVEYSISTADVERYAMEHFFNEAKEDLDFEVLEAPNLEDVQMQSNSESNRKEKNFEALYSIINSIDEALGKIADCLGRHQILCAILYIVTVFFYNYCRTTLGYTIIYTFFMAILFAPIFCVVLMLLYAVRFVNLFLTKFIQVIEKSIG